MVSMHMDIASMVLAVRAGCALSARLMFLTSMAIMALHGLVV